MNVKTLCNTFVKNITKFQFQFPFPFLIQFHIHTQLIFHIQDLIHKDSPMLFEACPEYQGMAFTEENVILK